jgi:hypothetical protein
MVKLKCKKCENEWNYKGLNKYYATCTKCLSKVPVKEYIPICSSCKKDGKCFFEPDKEEKCHKYEKREE